MSAATRSASSSRVSGSPASASGMAAVTASSSAFVMPWYFSHPGVMRHSRVRITAIQVRHSAAGSRCSVPRMAHVLSRDRSFHSRVSTSTRRAPRTARTWAAEDSTCVCTPAR